MKSFYSILFDSIRDVLPLMTKYVDVKYTHLHLSRQNMTNRMKFIISAITNNIPKAMARPKLSLLDDSVREKKKSETKIKLTLLDIYCDTLHISNNFVSPSKI